MKLHSSNAESDRGATMLETALMLPLFFLILFVSFDLLKLAFNCLTLRYVAATVMRQVTVGEFRTAPDQQSAIKDKIVSMAAGLSTSVEPGDVKLCKLENYPCTAWNNGEQKDLVVLEVNAFPSGFVMHAATYFGIDRQTFAVAFRVVGRIEP